MQAKTSGALAGVRVIDSTTMVAMPTTANIMADMGAEVIKVESHTIFRTESDRLIYAEGDPGTEPWNRDGSFNTLQHGKLGATFNFKTEEGIEGFKELVRISDVMIENNRAGTMDRLGLGYEDLKKIKPDLIYVSNTGFGHTGPWKRYAGIGRMFELTCGVSQFTGYLDEGPRRVGKAFFDLHVGWAGVFAILAALHYRQQTGKGQWLDFSMYQVGVSTVGDVILDFVANGRNGEVLGNRHATFAPQGVYPCLGSDQWIGISIEDNEQWDRFKGFMGNPDWAQDSRFNLSSGRMDDHDEIDTYLADWTRVQDAFQLEESLQAAGIPAAAVKNSRQVLTDPHLDARGFFEHVKHPEDSGLGERVYTGRPWKMSGTPAYIRRPAPRLGEDNDYVFQDLLGRTPDDMKELERVNAIGKDPIDPPVFKPLTYDKQLEDGTLAAVDTEYRKVLRIE